MELVVRRGDRQERVEIVPTVSGYALRIGERRFEVNRAAAGAALMSLLIDGEQYELSVHQRGTARYRITARAGVHDVEVVDPLTWLAQQAHGPARVGGRQRITAYMPGRVVEVLVEEGQSVEPGEGLVVLEAMKMENEIKAERAGEVKKVHVAAGDAVDGGAVLVEIE